MQRILKRCFDLFFSISGIITLSPLFLIIMFIIKFSSKGPLFFLQRRVGKNGKTFTAVKFRSMYTGTDKSGTITASTDTRITPPGKFMRRFKLDELPQLFNVLIGKMSFVGPRPDVPGYADKLTGDERRILELRPGITGPATIYFRNEEELLASVENQKEYNDTVIWPKKVELNLAYIDKWSFWKDIGYILVTLFPALNKVFRLVEEAGELNR